MVGEKIAEFAFANFLKPTEGEAQADSSP